VELEDNTHARSLDHSESPPSSSTGSRRFSRRTDSHLLTGTLSVAAGQRSTLTSSLHCRAYEIQEPCAATWNTDTKDYFVTRVEKLKKEVVAELKAQGFAEDMIQTECYLNMR
jgi:hypothetical protein